MSMNPADDPTASGVRVADSPISLTRPEQRLIRNAARFRVTLFFAFVLLAAVCYIWREHFNRFTVNPFFLAYNLTVYVGLIWAAFYTAMYQRRVHILFQRLRQLDT